MRTYFVISFQSIIQQKMVRSTTETAFPAKKPEKPKTDRMQGRLTSLTAMSSCPWKKSSLTLWFQ